MTIYNLSIPVVQGLRSAVKTTTPDTDDTNSITTAGDPTAREEERLLRIGNGIRDAIVFPRLREMGVAEVDLHRVAMRMVRRVQWTRDFNGPTAKLLGVVPCGVNGTAAAPEVV